MSIPPETPFTAACLGGGNGVVATMRGVLLAGGAPTGLIGVTDNGRSTGVVRAMFGSPAPGDLRAVLAAFATDRVLADLFEYRLETPTHPALTGMAFGNLVLGALARQTGSFAVAVEQAARVLGVTLPVIPLAVDSADLCAELADGVVARGEVEVRRPNKAPIARVFIDPPIAATPAALDAIRAADLVTLGPGSLFTSLLACLAVDGVADAFAAARGVRVYLANTTTQPGQSDDLPLAAQIDHVLRALDGAIDVVVVNQQEPPPDALARHEAEGRFLLRPAPDDSARFAARGVALVVADLLDADPGPRALWNKADALRHDPARLGAVLRAVARKELHGHAHPGH